MTLEVMIILTPLNIIVAIVRDITIPILITLVIQQIIMVVGISSRTNRLLMDIRRIPAKPLMIIVRGLATTIRAEALARAGSTDWGHSSIVRENGNEWPQFRVF